MAGEYVNCYPSTNNFPDSNILIIADSRGHRLDLHLSEILKCNFRLVTCRGADLLNSVLRSKYHVKDESWTQVYCIAGICGLTHKDKISRRVILRSLDPESAAIAYKNHLLQSETILRSLLLNENCKIIFGPVTGMNLCTYNRSMDTAHRRNLQCILNSSIKLVNKEIMNVNELNAVSTPWLCHHILRI